MKLIISKGMSKRIWSHRMDEHDKTDHASHVYEHHLLEGHEINFDNVEILNQWRSYTGLIWGVGHC